MARRILSVDEQDGFELDGDGRLYWQGERVLTEVKLSLPWVVNAAVILASIATAGTFVIAGLQTAGMLEPPTSINVNIDRSLIGSP